MVKFTRWRVARPEAGRRAWSVPIFTPPIEDSGRATHVGVAILCMAIAASMAAAQERGAKPPIDSAQGKQAAAKIPSVALSKGHAALCKVKVGDTMPDITLPQLGEDSPVKLSSLYGERATVVVFWNSSRRMAREQLADIGPDVIEPFGKSGVTVVGVVVERPTEEALSMLQEAKAEFPNLHDADGQAFAKVGSEKLPRTYVLDPQGKILWFDIEYSLSTRRDLNQTLRVVTGSGK